MQRVAAYCRVSTDKEDQVGSLENQTRYFQEYIARNPLWQLTEIYVDEGITGTSTKKRAAFHRMIIDAQNRQFDLLLTKEISRFARNTLDSIYYTRRLKEWGVGVIFLRDNINTLDPDAELRLTILSSIAQEESRKTSDRVKWGQKRRMEQGVVFGRSPLGYDVQDGGIRINSAGAAVVRLIFHKFVREGKGAYVIARELEEAGIPACRGGPRWSGTVVLRILRNEKYCGDLIQKKTWTPDYLTHQKKPNRGEEALVTVRDHHPPIVSRELWEQAQQALAQRRPPKEHAARYSSRYCFSGKLRCAQCGSVLISRMRRRPDGSLSHTWRCQQAVRGGKAKCGGPQIPHEDLLRVMSLVTAALDIDREAVVQKLMTVIESALCLPPVSSFFSPPPRIRQIEEKRLRLIDLYLSGELAESDYQNLLRKYEKSLSSLRREPQDAAAPPAALADIASCLRAMLSGEVRDESFYGAILDHIAVESRASMEVFLRDVQHPFCAAAIR